LNNGILAGDFKVKDFQAFPAPAKINLFLHITGQRADGYHLLQTVFRMLDFHDTIHLRPNNDGSINRIRDTAVIPLENDLSMRAAILLQHHTGCKKGVDIALDKHIPIGGGVGGGSSDAATVLLALNRLWNLNLPRTELLALGLHLGADVPFFIFGKSAWAEGVGEELQTLSLEPAYYVLLTPPVHVSTAQVFASEELTRNTIPTTIAAFSRALKSGNMASDGLFNNDLEPVVCRQYPIVAQCLEELSRYSRARMSGSGASVFAAFENQAEAKLVLEKVLNRTDEKRQHIAGFMAQGLDQHPLYSFAD
jgi:4-diphosphocytidyl-2-C-methyl-D-erythritol kinase